MGSALKTLGGAGLICAGGAASSSTEIVHGVKAGMAAHAGIGHMYSTALNTAINGAANGLVAVYKFAGITAHTCVHAVTGALGGVTSGWGVTTASLAAGALHVGLILGACYVLGKLAKKAWDGVHGHGKMQQANGPAMQPQQGRPLPNRMRQQGMGRDYGSHQISGPDYTPTGAAQTLETTRGR